jgi:phage terminase large subunit-like protein
MIGADPFFLGQMLQSWMESGFPVQEVPTNAVPRAVDACKRFYDAVVEQRVKWDGNHILRRHMANCQPKQDARGIRVVADRSNPLAKIDCAIAAIFAHMMATKVAAEPKVWLY